MRASGVKAALVLALQAIAPDAPTHESFTHVDLAGREPGMMPERTFTLELGAVPRHARGPAGAPLMSTDGWVANYDLMVFYAPADGVEDRMADDADRISQTLHQLHEEDREIFMIDVVPGVVARVEGALAASWNLDITYRRTGV